MLIDVNRTSSILVECLASYRVEQNICSHDVIDIFPFFHATTLTRHGKPSLGFAEPSWI